MCQQDTSPIPVLPPRLSENMITDWCCAFLSFVVSSLGTAWSPQCAVERTHLETMRPPPLCPKPRLHPSPPARWPLLDPIASPLSSPSVPTRPGTHHHRAAICLVGQSSRLTSPIVLAAVGTAATSAGQTPWRASMCTFSPFNHGECSAGLTDF